MQIVSRRGLKRIVIGLLMLVGGLLVVNGVLAWRAQQRLSSRLAAIRAAGDPTSLAEMAPPPISPDNDAAVYLEKIKPDLKAFEIQEIAYEDSAEGKDLPEQDKNQLPSAAQIASLQKIVEAFPAIPKALQQAANCTEYASKSDYSLPPSKFLKTLIDGPMLQFRTLGRFVRWRMLVLAANGKADEAIQTGIQTLRLTRLYDREPLMINYLVSAAVRGTVLDTLNKIIRLPGISANTRAELDAELALQDSQKPLETALASERGFALPYIQEHTGALSALLRWPQVNWYIREIDAEDAGIAFAKKPLGLSQPATDGKPYQQWPRELTNLVDGPLIGPAILATLSAHFRVAVQSRCLRVLNAMEAYKQRNGADAKSIVDLGLPADATIDLWTGEPLLIKRTDSGWIVYSTGANGADDGGIVEAKDRAGWAPPNKKGVSGVGNDE
jgi:hypothetical protein